MLIVFFGCSKIEQNSIVSTTTNPQSGMKPIRWQKVDTIDVATINAVNQAGRRTIDVGIYFPSNFDTAFYKVTLARMIESFQAAQEIYARVDVQLNLLWVKTGEVDPRYFAIQSNKIPGIPSTEYVNLYQHSKRHPAELTPLALEAFERMIEPAEYNDRTIYLIALQEVFYPYLEVSEGRNWMIKSVRTGGLSFPGYSYPGTIPDRLRGVITITNLSRPDRYRRTIAHEIGHKAMNVSHEYKDTSPGFEVFADGGLMLYGDGEDIPSGKEGRYHLERLYLSPYVYTMDDEGNKQYNPDFKEGGHYYDPIYGDKVIYFPGQAPIEEDW